jgi:predicted DNA binding CopG/RHH family protein
MGRKFLKTIPMFNSEKEEAIFWDRVDSTQYFSGKGNVHLKLPLRTKSISLRLPIRLLERLKRLAQIKDVPYQSLLKIYIDEKVQDEISGLKRTT